MNQIFGYQISPEGTLFDNIVFDGMQSIVPSTNFDCNHSQLQIFTHPHSHFQSCFSHEYDAFSYVWGIPTHPQISRSDIPKWCAYVVANKHYNRFRELIGNFVVITDEPKQHRITFVTDILGVRPMFFGKHDGRIVFGSNVWPIHKAGLCSGAIDYDAISAWIAYGYNCTNGSLFSDLHRLPPGSAIVFQDNRYSEIPYTEFNSNSKMDNAQNVVKDLHDIVLTTVKTLLKEHNQISLSLSGGFDSRYLLALIKSIGKTSVECATVGYPVVESHIASKVAEALEVPLEIFPVGSSIWDLFDDVYHFTPDGFPITKNLNYFISEQHPHMPMVNGFMGDLLIRGSRDSIMGKYEEEWDEDLADVLQNKYLFANFKLFRKDIAERIKIRSRIPMEKAVEKGSIVGKIFVWADYYYRQRLYISNNFLEHININEVLLPFYSWELFSYKMSHDKRLFNMDTYKMIFQTYFPELSKVPHSSELPSKKNQLSRIARCTKPWARQILLVICDKKWLSLLQKKRCILRNVAGIVGLRRAESTIFHLQRLYLLEKSAKDAGLDFDWDCI